MSATLKYPSKVRITMGSKFFTYQGKQVGFVRKMVDDVILVEDAWVNEVRLYLGKNGYDTLLEMVARVLSAGGHPPVTRAQAWIILAELLRDGVPEVLQNTSADQVSNKGNLFATMKNTTASAIDSVANPVGSVVGRGMNIVKKNKPASDATGDKIGE